MPSQSLVTERLGEPRAAVHFENVSGLTIDRCTFRHIGAAYALAVQGASHDARITASTFTALAGGAVKLGNVLTNGRELSTDPANWDDGFLLSDCTVQAAALDFRGAAAVFAGYVARTNITHNTIRDTGYTGISLGWGWGSHVSGAQTFAADNHVVGNRLEGVMAALNDGGCTYTLGPQPRSTVSDNYCAADHAPVVGCFYHDNGSRYFGTSNNVAERSPAPCVYLQGCCNSPAYDIAVRGLWCV